MHRYTGSYFSAFTGVHSITMCTHHNRVVGLWDNQKRFLKCYSVRPARGKEEECAGEFVRASDHSMRETVATAHEN